MHPDFIAEPVDKQMLKVISGSVTGAFACVELVPLTLHQQSSKIAGLKLCNGVIQDKEQLLT